jgi:hypothetical protein
MSLSIRIRGFVLFIALSSLFLVSVRAQDDVSGGPALPAPDPLLNSRGEEKLILGGKEMIYLPDPAVFLPARVDSGAAYSSVHASQIRRFVRDGREWVAFNLDFDGQDRFLERPLEDLILIRQAGSVNISERPVVFLDIRLGPYPARLSFSLADRRHMTLPVILGRDFLHDRALVDVSHEYLMSAR